MKPTSSALALVGLFSMATAGGCARKDAATVDPVASAPTSNPAAAPPLVTWRDGDVYTYRVELSSRSQAELAPSAIAFSLSASLTVRSESGADGTKFFAELHDVSVRGALDGGAADFPPELDADLAHPWGFELAGGSYRAIRVRGSTSAFAVGILNTVAAAMQSPTEAADGGGWEHTEADASGVYHVQYVAGANSGELSRVKTAYVKRPLASAKLPFGSLDAAPSILESQGTLRLRAGDLAGLTTHEALEANLTAGSKVRSTTDLSLALVDHHADASSIDWASLRDSTVALPPGAVLNARPAIDPYDLKLAADMTFPKALAAAEHESAPAPGSSANPLATSAPDDRTFRDRERVFATVVALLRTRPGTVALANAAIDRGSPARSLLLDALGSAGTPETLDALVARVNHAGTPPELRRKAAFALIRSPHPSDATVNELIALLGDSDLRSYAILGLGTYCRRLREAGNVALANRAGDALIPLLDSAHDKLDRVEILQGIANAGDERAFNRVQPLVDDPDDGVRAAAVDAIRLMPNPEVDAMVARRMSPDEKVVVRLEAIDAARLRSASPPLLAAVRTAATGSEDSESRLKSVRLLQKWMPDRPEVRATLEQVARTDAREAVRQAAKAALGT
jgi:HEAT repeat protein